ncbi:molybdenum ABC transporter ATP-binding protein [Rhizobium sp. TRM95796]|uniref:molybdenum ABC transporter ATP-binding protein n=1 Tax=Rhizobium sp. TRM95796 TaxID=2979862 RepID=UPI0021E8E972|nr:molybdenum ABC transporter ATP-binding protein [Rhizobium sp. TRM95796]MCV3766346.1 molybdenum ABC transporter ATP-binding protein [Rhizobium sp. TRM95796]
MIEVDIRHRQGDFDLAARFTVDGGLTALFGASGSGKTTLVRMLAGLTRPDEGIIRFDGAVWSDAQRGLFTPPHRRCIGYVFQESLLFPHLTARQNLLYGRFFSRGASGMREDDVVDLLGVSKLLTQRPATLSGGEKQRIAIGRALLSNPQLILMDEPLSALDRARKAEILPYIERIRDEFGIPIVYVSHSVEEVARLANRIVLLDEGRVKAVGGPADVLAGVGGLTEPLAPQAVIEARLVGHDPYYGVSIAEIGAHLITIQEVAAPIGAMLRLRIPATDVVLSQSRPVGLSALNILPCTIKTIAAEGRQVLVTLDCHGQTLLARITLLSAERLELAPGEVIHAVFKAVTGEAAGVYREV